MKTIIIDRFVGPEKLLLFATVLTSSVSSAVSFSEASLVTASPVSLALTLLSSSCRNSDFANRESSIGRYSFKLKKTCKHQTVKYASNLYDPASSIWKNIYRWIFLHFAGWCDTREPAPELRCCSPVWSVLNKVVHINFNLDLHVLSMGKRIMDRQSTPLWEFTSRLGGNNPLSSSRKPLISLFLLRTTLII